MSFWFPSFRRSGRMVLSLLVPTLLLGGFCLAQEKKAKPETAAQHFKNIKVLKTLPAGQMAETMGHYTKALGVECGFCHAYEFRSGFEKDDKPAKTKARQMILMTEDLNKRYKTVEKKVTCFTCHRGKPEPANSPEEK